ncbi:MAG TPA: SRPBCC family protein [Pseudoxanthomonas sp.]|nr:SRPBCC family protein [Pseudoxanthomonas sp.]
MKTIKWMLMAVAIAGLALVLGGLLLPSTTQVQRSIVIERPATEVFAILDSFQRQREWSPWSQDDPQAVYSFGGPGSGVGAKMIWTGNAAIGSGSQEIVESVPYRTIATRLEFDGSLAALRFDLEPEAAGTRVTWSMSSAHGYNPMHRWFGALLLEPMVGPDLERGLANLKRLMEASPPD